MNETQQEHYAILTRKQDDNNQHQHYHHDYHYHHHHHQQQQQLQHPQNNAGQESDFKSVLLSNNNQDDNTTNKQQYPAASSLSSLSSSSVSHENQLNRYHSVAGSSEIVGAMRDNCISDTTNNSNSDSNINNNSDGIGHQQQFCSLESRASTGLYTSQATMVTLAQLQTPQENASSSGGSANSDNINNSPDGSINSSGSLISSNNISNISPSNGNNSSIDSSSSSSKVIAQTAATPQPPVAVATDDRSATTTPLERRCRPQKYCAVCGDKAIACNFNAVTCESCKAFFRRNAFKDQRLKCLFENRCIIDRVTRRFCSKCRLLKCLQIGMKREWILTDEQKQIKKVKIMQNKQSKQQQQQLITTTKPLPTKPPKNPNQLDDSQGVDYDYDNSSSPASNSKACSGDGDVLGKVEASDRLMANGSRFERREARMPTSTISDGDHHHIRNSRRPVETKDATTSCPDEFDLEPSSGGGSLLLHHRQQHQQLHYCSLASQCQYCSVRLTGCPPLPLTSNHPQTQHVTSDYQPQQHHPDQQHNLHNLNSNQQHHHHQHLQSQHHQMHQHHPTIPPQATYGQHQQVAASGDHLAAAAAAAATSTIYGNGDGSSGQVHQPGPLGPQQPPNMVADGVMLNSDVTVVAPANAGHWQQDIRH